MITPASSTVTATLAPAWKAIDVRAVEFLENEAGDPITRLELDAAVPIEAVTEGLPEDEETEPLDLAV